MRKSAVPAEELLDRFRVGVVGVHLALQGFELRKRESAGAAARRRFCNAIAGFVELRRRERCAAGCRKRRRENIGRGVKVTLGMTAHEFCVFGESDVTLENACAHAIGGDIRLPGVFRELERGSAMADGKITVLVFFGLGRALRQLVFEIPVAHLIDEEERARAELHVGLRVALLGMYKRCKRARNDDC